MTSSDGIYKAFYSSVGEGRERKRARQRESVVLELKRKLELQQASISKIEMDALFCPWSSPVSSREKGRTHDFGLKKSFAIYSKEREKSRRMMDIHIYP
jgi:hypothetical protein